MEVFKEVMIGATWVQNMSEIVMMTFLLQNFLRGVRRRKLRGVSGDLRGVWRNLAFVSHLDQRIIHFVEC